MSLIKHHLIFLVFFYFILFCQAEIGCVSGTVGTQLYAGRSEEQLAFGIKKKRTALDIGEGDRKGGFC